MIFEAESFIFRAPSPIARAERVLIKPGASSALPYPATTSRYILEKVIAGIRQVSDADILLLEGNEQGKSMHTVYKALGYDFPRVLTLDVKDCLWVEVENPLTETYALPTFWVPNVVLLCDYLISLCPFKLSGNNAILTIKNLITLLPVSKYGDETGGWGQLFKLGIERVAADLYFTLPFDLGIIEARQKFVGSDDSAQGEIEDYGKIFVGEPYEVDYEVSEALGLKTEYLGLIREAKAGVESQ